MLKKRIKQFCIIRQKQRTLGFNWVFSKKKGGIFSPRRVTNFFLKLRNPLLHSAGNSWVSSELIFSNIDHFVILKKVPLWGPWLIKIQKVLVNSIFLKQIFSPLRIPFVYKHFLSTFCSLLTHSERFFFVLHILLFSKIK